MYKLELVTKSGFQFRWECGTRLKDAIESKINPINNNIN
jgi:hypothetical protein